MFAGVPHLATVGLAVAAFVSTNVDDIFVVSALFADSRVRPQSVIAGQFLGVGALVIASAAAAILALAIPEGWISLLGFVPLSLGVRKLLVLRRSAASGDRSTEDRKIKHEEVVAERRIHSQTLAVAGVTMANGADNIGVYVPLFAKAVGSIGIYAIVFACMTAIWCGLGYALVNNRVLGGPLRRYGHVVLPIVLVVLGIYILSGAAVLLG